MNANPIETLRVFESIYENPTVADNFIGELREMKQETLEIYRSDPSLADEPSAFKALAGLRIVMNRGFLANDDERSEVDSLLTQVLKHSPMSTAETRVTECVGLIVAEDRDWGAFVAIAGAAVCSHSSALTPNSAEKLEKWTREDATGFRDRYVRRFLGASLASAKL